MSHCTVYAITNQKGGVGKTTTTVNLGIGLAKAGKKVLLIDFDPQASLTASLGYKQPDELDDTISTVLEHSIADKPKKAKKAGLPRERFCRRVLNDTIVQEAPPAEFSELIRQVKRTGSNIDQLLKMARANGFLQLTELQLAIDHNLSTEQMLWDTFCPVRK